MEYQWNKCYSIGTNRTNGQVECTTTRPEADRNILSPYNEMHFTNGIPMEEMIFHWYKSYQWTSEMLRNILGQHNEMHFTNGIPMD